MSTYTTDQAIDLSQLGTELGTNALSMSDDGTTRTITCHDESITQGQLQAAVDAHVPAPAPPSVDARLQAQIDELTDVLIDLLP